MSKHHPQSVVSGRRVLPTRPLPVGDGLELTGHKPGFVVYVDASDKRLCRKWVHACSTHGVIANPVETRQVVRTDGNGIPLGPDGRPMYRRDDKGRAVGPDGERMRTDAAGNPLDARGEPLPYATEDRVTAFEVIGLPEDLAYVLSHPAVTRWHDILSVLPPGRALGTGPEKLRPARAKPRLQLSDQFPESGWISPAPYVVPRR
jgi:hypothetical protein